MRLQALQQAIVTLLLPASRLYGFNVGQVAGMATNNPFSEQRDDTHHAIIERRLMETAIGGDPMGGLRQMLLAFDELPDLWADPRVFQTVLEGFPLLRAIKGVDGVAAKEGAITEEEVRERVKGARGTTL